MFDLYRGNCLEIMPRLLGETVDAVITDPPYGIDYQSARRTDKSKRLAKIANDAQPFLAWIPEAFRLTKPIGALLCFCRWDVQSEFENAIRLAGWTLRSQVIWDREVHGLGDLKATYAPRHDVIWFATKGNFSFPGMRPPSVVRNARLSGEALVHPNQKPVDLMRQLVEHVTKRGG